jgi:hypothetical protein
MITRNDSYRDVVRISRRGFAARLAGANAGVLAERPADAYYDEAIRIGVDPLFLLAMFNHESAMGRAGVAVTTKSWGNTRTPNFGAVPVGTAAGASGTFPIWASWLDGMRSTATRLVTPEWYYRYERRNIGEVFDDPHWPALDPNRPAMAPAPRIPEEGPIEWAPAGDMNNPAAYLASMLAYMNRYADTDGEASVGTYPKPAMIDYPSPNRDTYSTPRNIRLIVDHIGTGTKSSNLAWLTNPASKASCNAYIDKAGTIYELVPITSSPWTNGQVKNPDLANRIIADVVRAGINPNTVSYTIEHEGNPGDDLTEAQIRANAEVTAWVASVVGMPVSRETKVGHYQFDNVDRWYCPSFTDAEWQRLIDGANRLLSGDPDPDVPRRHFPETGYDIVWGFKGYWEALERAGQVYPILGYPLTGEFRAPVDGTVRTVQLFERGALGWYPESAGTPWEYRHLTRDETRDVEAFALHEGII